MPVLSATAPSGRRFQGRLPILFGLAGVIGVAWAYLLTMAWGMEHMDVGADMLIMPRMTDWGIVDLALVFLMWSVMMVAMMLPSALPMIRAYQAIAAQPPATAYTRRVLVFVAAYVAVWTAFSVLMTLVQWGLLNARLVSPMMELRDPRLGGVLLLVAGAYQFSALKHACVSRCRSPLSFLMTEWRGGVAGAWRMGLRHGWVCTGCCGLLMALLFVLGVMNLLWIAVLTIFVLVEKSLPRAHWISPLSGALLLAWGAALLLGAPLR